MSKAINTSSIYAADVLVHSGPFQADDALTCAILALAQWPVAGGDPLRVLRTRDADLIAEADNGVVVADVGGVFDPAQLRFDHHQRGFDQVRPNGVKYASCGLVWDFMPGVALQAVGNVIGNSRLDGLLSEKQMGKVVDKVGQGLVAAVDAVDNGQKAKLEEGQDIVPPTFSLSLMVHQLNPVGQATAHDFDEAFITAVDVCAIALESAIKQAAAEVLSEDRVAEAVAKGDTVVVFDQYEAAALELVPALSEEALYIVFPSNGTWMVQQVPVKAGSFEGRKPLPEEWAGLRAENGDSIEGLESFVFVHNGRFIGGCRKEEDAVRMARMAVEA